MPRKPRIHVAGGFYHVILRGNSRQDIFDCDDDRELWESLISRAIAQHGHRLHAYCWMTNHVHLAIQAGAEPLAGFMSVLASHYARTTNLRKQRTGHLFERRYRALLVQADSYLLELVRYIHLNPVRAKMVAGPEDYHWSSHRAYLAGPHPDWLTIDTVLGLFASSTADARRRYTNFMRQQASAEVVCQLRSGNQHDGRALGEDEWLSKLLDELWEPGIRQSLDELVGETCARYGIEESQLAAPDRSRHLAHIRAEIALAATTRGIASVSEVARRFGRAQPTLSRAMQRLKRAANKL